MELKNPLLAVAGMERSAAFYERAPGLRVILDFGAGKVLTGGLCPQTPEQAAERMDVPPGYIQECMG